MIWIKSVVVAVIGLSSGVIVAGGIFAFIAVIGIVPRLAQRSRTPQYISLYEDAIMLGGIFGTLTMFMKLYVPIGTVGAVIFSFCTGIFVGCLAVSLAEVFDVIPIFARRARVTKGIPVMLLAIALGKCLGSLAYFYLAGFSA